MAESRDDPTIHLIDPKFRGVMDLDALHISQSLARKIRRNRWQVTVDLDFTGVMRACADREETWINEEIFQLYQELHDAGHAHSVEVREDGRLIGGLYGVRLGGAFFGESMFSQRSDASKLALAWLVHRLRAGGFTLLDMQFLTPHLASLGGTEITRSQYRARLRAALKTKADFFPAGYSPDPSSVASSPASSASGASTTSGGT